MNTIGGTQPVRQVNTELLTATQLVDAVRRDVESLVPQALREGAVTVSQTRLQQWLAALQTAIALLERIPAPLIFPPPAFITFINGAVAQINQAIATINAIPVVTPLIFPPQPGQASVSLETLQTILNDLQQAEILLIQAIGAA